MKDYVAKVFSHAFVSLCESVSSLAFSLQATLAADPVSTVRSILNNSNIAVEHVSRDFVKVKKCSPLKLNQTSTIFRHLLRRASGERLGAQRTGSSITTEDDSLLRAGRHLIWKQGFAHFIITSSVSYFSS